MSDEVADWYRDHWIKAERIRTQIETIERAMATGRPSAAEMALHEKQLRMLRKELEYAQNVGD